MLEDPQKVLDSDNAVAINVFVGPLAIPGSPTLKDSQEVLKIHVTVIINVLVLPPFTAVAYVLTGQAITEVQAAPRIAHTPSCPGAFSLHTTGASRRWTARLEVVAAHPPTLARAGVVMPASAPVTCVRVTVVPVEPDHEHGVSDAIAARHHSASAGVKICRPPWIVYCRMNRHARFKKAFAETIAIPMRSCSYGDCYC
jgi:hypothetical protein